jgi:hypothetical protein
VEKARAVVGSQGRRRGVDKKERRQGTAGGEGRRNAMSGGDVARLRGQRNISKAVSGYQLSIMHTIDVGEDIIYEMAQVLYLHMAQVL